MKKLPGHESGKALMAHGPHALHDYLALTVQAALGRSLPQMEVRIHNLSVSAGITVVGGGKKDGSSAPQANVPTITTSLKKNVGGVIAKKQVVTKEILKNVSAVFKPGTMTLVLGQPGSGKSSLMKILSGRFPLKSNITVEGGITYNGEEQSKLRKVLPQFTAYVTQHDTHYPVLSVKETLEFAHAFTGGELSRRGEELLSKGTPEENIAALEAAKALFRHYPEVIIEQLGLQQCQDTIVGNAMLRGVSGGERKRVTTGEMEFGMKYVTLMDEISTGLDSAATYDIINAQRSIAKTLRKTVVIALLQPSPEVFNLFDDVLIMNEGEVMYYGPREQVVSYFQDLGFVCPPDRDVADFLLDLGTEKQVQYQVVAPNKHPRHAAEFAEIFRRSQIYVETLRSLDEPHDPELLETVGSHMDLMPEFHQSFWENTWTLTRRQFMVAVRNTASQVGRLIMIAVMGILFAITYYQFDPTDIQIGIGVLFSAVAFVSWGQVSQTFTFIAARDIFYKQRAANFYRTSSYVLANSLSQFPFAIAECLSFGTLVYWTCGLYNSAGAYILFELVLFLNYMALNAWFFFISSVSPNLNIGGPVASVSALLFLIFAGFIVTKTQIPDYLIWVYWLSPVTWSLRALAVNEYRSDTFNVCEYDGVEYCDKFNGLTIGEYLLGIFDFQTEKFWMGYGILFLVVFYFVCLGLSTIVLEYMRYEAPEYVALPIKPSDDDIEGYAVVETPRGSLTVNDALVLDVKDSARNVIPVTLAFKDLWYSVPRPGNPKESIDLLKGITGYALPGTMTALMGSSGAGKTTLMDVIAGRKTAGKIRGKIFLNGYEATDLAIRRATGYCEQTDIHSEASTFREALTFSALLRQDASVPSSKKYDTVNECLELLDLQGIADQMIRGSSVEQMKRLTIGVELAAQPSVLFLDEPTSGLDARSAKAIMTGVRNVANTGRTVVCTIHQPSLQIFELFDNLLLLKRGGETVFFGDLGEGSRNVIKHFEAIAGVSPLPHGYNPSSWMLECIGAGVSNNSANDIDFVQVFKQSEMKAQLDKNIDAEGITRPAHDYPEMLFTKKRAASSYTQFLFVTKRFMDLYNRTPSYNLTRMVLAVVVALVFGLTYIDVAFTSYKGINSGIGVITASTVFSGFVSFSGVLPVAAIERASFYRERASQTYNALWYFVGSTLAEIPYVFATGLLFTAIFFPMVGFTGFDTAVLYWLNFSLSLLSQTYMGQLLAYAVPGAEVAGIIGVLVITIFFTFLGFVPPANAIPAGLKWLYYVNPHRYTIAILSALVFSDCETLPDYDKATGTFSNVSSELGCQPLLDTPVSIGPTTVKEFTEDVFRMKHDEIWSNFGYVLLFIVAFRLLGLLALRYINHQRR